MGLIGWVSAVTFASAYLVMTALHELAHAVAAVAYGLDPVVWYGTKILHAPGGAGPETVIALAGPVFSLLSGLALLALGRAGRGGAGLFPLWLGLLSVGAFFGYLLSGPFPSASGDIATAVRLQRVPIGLAFLGALAGMGGLVWLGAVVSVCFHQLAPDGTSPPAALRRLGWLPFLAGIIPLVLIGTPAPS
jgi:hypothetical protein